MTIIVTHINRFGIVHGADSNLSVTVGSRQTVRETQKLFQIDFLNAAVTVAGNSLIDQESMDDWMSTFIEAEQANGTSTLRQFSEHLRDSWFRGMREDQRAIGNWAHIAGFAVSNGFSYPECWFVSNIVKQELGEPLEVSDNFHRWEDFATRDARTEDDLLAAFSRGSNGHSVTYLNGHPSGRILMNLLASVRNMGVSVGGVFDAFLLRPGVLAAQISNDFVSQEQQNEFLRLAGPFGGRVPNSLQESEILVRDSILLIRQLFELSNDDAIGGESVTFAIPFPAEMLQTVDRLPSYSELEN